MTIEGRGGADAVRRLALGMVGGGTDAFIGAVHRRAATMDGEAEVVGGALSSTPERALASARALGLAEDRAYPTWEAMLAGELARDESDRIDAVIVVTPNHLHFPVADAFLESGIPVVTDKPMVHTVEQADALVTRAASTGTPLFVTYNYSGYPMVRAARELVRRGDLGPIRKVFVEYHQGWLAGPLERTGQKQAGWRTDPARAGAAGCVSDIGTHAEHLVSFVTGLEIAELCADVATFVEGRALDDDASLLLRYGAAEGVVARGTLTCTQVAVGEANGLTLRLHGERGGLRWRQEAPETLDVCGEDGAWRTIRRADPGAGDLAAAATRLPGGHPEGFHEAFANLYRGVFEHLRGGGAGGPLADLVPTGEDGARGIRFVEAVVASGRAGGTWTAVARCG